jgi:hypothetical protein
MGRQRSPIPFSPIVLGCINGLSINTYIGAVLVHRNRLICRLLKLEVILEGPTCGELSVVQWAIFSGKHVGQSQIPPIDLTQLLCS